MSKKRPSFVYEPEKEAKQMYPSSSSFVMSEDITSSKEDAVVLRPKKFGSEKYISSHETYVYVKDSQLINFTQKQEFNLDLVQKGTNYVYKLEITQGETNDGLNLKQQMDDMLDKILALKHHLVLTLSEEGRIQKVSNMAEIQQKWLKLKQEMQAHEAIRALPRQLTHEVFTKGDQEHALNYPLHKELYKQLFFFGLFFPLYNRPFTSSRSITLSQLYITSVLFKELMIPVRVTMDCTYDEEMEAYTIRLDGNVDKAFFSRKVIEEAYKKNYPFIKESFSKYTCHIQALYMIDAASHRMEYIEMEVEEQVNNILTSIQELDIETVLVDDEDSESTNFSTQNPQ